MASSIGSLSIVLDGKYRLDDLLGEGAAGVVYRATHLGLQRVFALKLLKPGPALDAFSGSRFHRGGGAPRRARRSPRRAALRGAGGDPRRAGRPRLGPLLVRRDRLRDARRPAAVRGNDAGGPGRASRRGAPAGSALRRDMERPAGLP